MHELREILQKYWGYGEFRPLQAEAMRTVVNGGDSVVVLATGGGKSLCFQAPALCMPGLAIVVSPLISLMKDQVDALSDCGVPAACVNSTLSVDERRRVADDMRAGRLKLVYMSPERLMTERTLQFLQTMPLSFIAIDEAHCISEWGHDFRPEYRMLQTLKQTFPGVGLHAYTATATPRVREDIARELGLDDPEILVGTFDRPNLVYRVQRRSKLLQQVRGVIDRYPNDSGIVYCIRRADVEELSASLQELGIEALPYHAGMDATDRKRNQEAFINDRAKIIVATVAFGMGIDKSNVRYVIHGAAPKSLESYQQESGRAGRDGLEAECWLFYSAGDFMTWRKLQADLPPQAHQIAMTVLAGIDGFCSSVQCRHRAIVQYFGQTHDGDPCNACDVCLAELDFVEDALVVAQKILSCVIRIGQNFGAEYTALVLAGSRDQRILDNQHDQLSTWGILSDQHKKSVRAWIDQLVGSGFLQKAGDYSVLEVTDAGRRVLRGEITPRLMKPVEKKSRRESQPQLVSWEGVDEALFEVLRKLRRRLATDRGLAPFIVFGDATLRDLARYRPSTPKALRGIHGVGEKKLADYGSEFLDTITQYCRDTGLPMDVTRPAEKSKSASGNGNADGKSLTRIQRQAFALFSEGKSIDEVSRSVDRAASTTMQYLVDFVEREGIRDPTCWIDANRFDRIRKAVEQVGMDRLRPIFDALDGEVPYDQIRIATACLRNSAMVT